MTTEDYRRALETAIREYEDLGQRRQAIDSRLGEIAQTIGTLSRLCGLVPTVPMGLTDACRLVTRGGVPMTPAEVRERLLSIGFDTVEVLERSRGDPHHSQAAERGRRVAVSAARVG
jgi:hypothetical protein